MNKQRLDQFLVKQKVVPTRSQAENYIKLGLVNVDGKTASKPGMPVDINNRVSLDIHEQYVSRAALKLASVSDALGLDFKAKVVLDVGSSTGGFSDYALKHGAKKVIAIDVGSDQMHPSLRNDPKIELHEKTDIRSIAKLSSPPAIVLIDVSFISLRQILPHIKKLVGKDTQIVAMFKPQFEAGKNDVHQGVIKNDKVRRQLLKNFEIWANKNFKVRSKADSQIAGAKGNLERFYLLNI